MQELKLLILSDFHKVSFGTVERHYQIKWSYDYEELKDLVDMVINKLLEYKDVSDESSKALKAFKRKKKFDPSYFENLVYEGDTVGIKCEFFAMGNQISDAAMKFYENTFVKCYMGDNNPLENDYRICFLRVEKEPANMEYLDEFLNMMKDEIDFDNKLGKLV